MEKSRAWDNCISLKAGNIPYFQPYACVILIKIKIGQPSSHLLAKRNQKIETIKKQKISIGHKEGLCLLCKLPQSELSLQFFVKMMYFTKASKTQPLQQEKQCLVVIKIQLILRKYMCQKPLHVSCFLLLLFVFLQLLHRFHGMEIL